jgi:hypothetical protein
MKDHTTPNELSPPIRVVWPPPGLEGSQGIFWRTAGRLGFGGSLLVVPFLFSVTVPQPFNSLGLFGSAWWFLGLTSLIGLVTVIRALGGLFNFFRTARRAALHGIDLETVLQVAADQDGEMGALIQGTRSYRSLDEGHRIRAVRARISAALLFLSAATWITAGWVLSFLLAGRGLLDPTGVWLLSLGPAFLILVAGTVAKGIEGTALQGAFGPLFWNRWRNAGLRDAAKIWGEELRRFRVERGERVTSGRKTLLAGALSVLGLATFVVIPAASFTVATSVGPAIASMAVPKFSATLRKAGEAEALRYLRLASDPAISPDDAGEALHVLASVGGRNEALDLIKDPVRTLETEFFPRGAENPLALEPHFWPTELIPLVLEGLTPEGEAFLREASSHPGLAEFEILAHAQAADFLGARLVLPLPQETSALDLPFPRLTGVREGGYSMVAKAALQLMDGSPDEAERTLRTLLSAGFLMGEDSPTLIGGLIGYVQILNAADGLEDLYEATGRQEDAESLRWLRAATKKASKLAQQGSLGAGVQSALKGMPGTVLSEEVIRGLRWEYFHTLTGLSPCINPNQMLFGADETLTEFLRLARAELVRYPAEEALFEVMERGWINFPTSGGKEGALMGIVKSALGGRAGSCAEVLASGVF